MPCTVPNAFAPVAVQIVVTAVLTRALLARSARWIPLGAVRAVIVAGPLLSAYVR